MTGKERLIRAVEACAVLADDGGKGYRLAASLAANADVRDFFLEQAGRRERFCAELWEEMATLAPHVTPHDGSAPAFLHRRLLSARSVASLDGDRAMLEECDRGERAAQRAYEVARAEAAQTPRVESLNAKLDAHYAAVCAVRLELEARLQGTPSPSTT